MSAKQVFPCLPRPALGAVLVLAGLSSACQPHESAMAAPVRPLAQAEPDARGCIPAHGEVWSVLQSRCLRPPEEGLVFESLPGHPEARQRAVLVMDRKWTPGDKGDVAELFWPGQSEPLVLRRPKRSGDVLLLDAKGLASLQRKVSDYEIAIEGQPRWVRPMHISERLAVLR